jgi:hypothetical protein
VAVPVVLAASGRCARRREDRDPVSGGSGGSGGSRGSPGDSFTTYKLLLKMGLLGDSPDLARGKP